MIKSTAGKHLMMPVPVTRGLLSLFIIQNAFHAREERAYERIATRFMRNCKSNFNSLITGS
ncbi:hypothetical protein [Fodinibius halophilus]|uniref:Uncharacterized protein n=1 Tax=Fodinibius halophilus TaxID=1736908 RepID=A0A6M1TD21_9BACT|nr:hypothetical protein [Fodinibius halophilus]NGP88724.1 hypothetical protein [Fodinibius halophilus]